MEVGIWEPVVSGLDDARGDSVCGYYEGASAGAAGVWQSATFNG